MPPRTASRRTTSLVVTPTPPQQACVRIQRVWRGWIARRSVVGLVRDEFATMMADVERRATVQALRNSQLEAQGGGASGDAAALMSSAAAARRIPPASYARSTLCRPRFMPPPPPSVQPVPPPAAAASVESAQASSPTLSPAAPAQPASVSSLASSAAQSDSGAAIVSAAARPDSGNPLTNSAAQLDAGIALGTTTTAAVDVHTGTGESKESEARREAPALLAAAASQTESESNRTDAAISPLRTIESSAAAFVLSSGPASSMDARLRLAPAVDSVHVSAHGAFDRAASQCDHASAFPVLPSQMQPPQPHPAQMQLQPDQLARSSVLPPVGAWRPLEHQILSVQAAIRQRLLLLRSSQAPSAASTPGFAPVSAAARGVHVAPALSLLHSLPPSEQTEYQPPQLEPPHPPLP